MITVNRVDYDLSFRAQRHAGNLFESQRQGSGLLYLMSESQGSSTANGDWSEKKITGNKDG